MTLIRRIEIALFGGALVGWQEGSGDVAFAAIVLLLALQLMKVTR